MNYFAHAHPHLDAVEVDAYFLAGLAVPDWLGVAARRTKCRTKHAEPFFADADPRVAALARGVARHHDDDRWFHETRAFTEVSLGFSKAIRERHGDGEALRPWFVGHLLLELLLDAELIAAAPARLDGYYRRMAGVDAALVAGAVERMTGRSAGRLAEFIPKFGAVRFLADYADDERLVYRVDQVMQRVGLSPLPAGFAELLPSFRRVIAQRADELLSPTGTRTIDAPTAY